MSTLKDDELREKVEELIPEVDLAETGLKQFISLLSDKVGTNLKSRKDFIRECLMEAIDKQQQSKKSKEEESGNEEEEAEDDDEETEEEEDDEEEEEPPPKAKKGRAAAAAGKRGTKKSGGGGLSAQKEISPELATLLGRKGKTMARTEIVKELWVYIRKYNLQNPDNKKEIFLDEAMERVFGCKTFTMFTMNKYISAHIHPFKPVDLTAPSSTRSASKSKKRKASTGGGGAGGSSDAKKRRAGTQPPYRLSEDLQAVVGVEMLPRPQVVKKLWDYIKQHGLQNPDDKRQIVCDEAFKRVMGGQRTVTMFNMNQYITPHLIEKVDRVEYQSPKEEEQEEEEEEEEQVGDKDENDTEEEEEAESE